MTSYPKQNKLRFGVLLALALAGALLSCNDGNTSVASQPPVINFASK